MGRVGYQIGDGNAVARHVNDGAVAAVGGLPDRPADGRGGVAALRQELPIAVTPEAADDRRVPRREGRRRKARAFPGADGEVPAAKDEFGAPVRRGEDLEDRAPEPRGLELPAR